MHVLAGRFAGSFLVMRHKSRTRKGERSLSALAATQGAHSEIRMDGILWLNDTHFQAKWDCKVETRSKISVQAMKKKKSGPSQCFCSS